MSNDLFDFAESNHPSNYSGDAPHQRPLAHRMRPTQLDEYVGQERVLGPGKPLRIWIDADRVPSLILWGPPGCGKTTLAQIIAQKTSSYFESLSAVHSGVKEIKEVVTRAKDNRRFHHRKTLLFVDEIHRFNKSQQDSLLPYVEDGTLTLVGATTENPSFEMNSALLSRLRVIRLDRLSRQAIQQTLEKALKDPNRGLGGLLQFSTEALEWLAGISEGDARKALTSLESIALHLGSTPGGVSSEPISLETAQEALESAIGRQPILYDKAGEEHYNVVSAFIKSIRDSDPHAGLYYLARMLEGGEDPIFIARRLVILASEDIGNADPRALQVAIAVKDAVSFIGMPEGRISLAQAVTYLAVAPKSNASYAGIGEALAEVQKSGGLPVPFHLRNAVTPLMSKEGYGKDYQYAHNKPQAHIKQTHLPKELVGTRYYRPNGAGLEAQIKARLDQLNPDFEDPSP